MKRLFILLLALVLLLCSCDATGGAIARIEFSGTGHTAEARHIEYDLSALEGREEALDQSLGTPPLLRNVAPAVDTDKLLAAFGMTGASKENRSDPEGWEYLSGTRSLVLYKSGIVSFSDYALYDKPTDFDADKAAALVKETAEAAGLDMSELTLDDVAPLDDGWSVRFTRTIRGLPVAGTTGLSADVRGGGISGFRYLSTAYADELAVDLIGVKAAMAELLTENSAQSFGRLAGEETAAISAVRVDSVSLVYWDSAYTQTKMNQTHIQPVYRFTGVCTDRAGNETAFTGYVRAVSDDLTVNFHVDDTEED